MRYTLIAFIIVGTTFFKANLWSQSGTDDILIHYDRPASRWNEAIPIGNGFMGAMIFGDVKRERIQLNEGTLYSGDPMKTFDHINVSNALDTVTNLIEKNKFKEAQDIITKEWLGRNHQMFQPMADLWIEFQRDSHQVKDYNRRLNLEDASVITNYKVGENSFRHTCFASYPDHVLVFRMEALGKEPLHCKLYLSTPHKPTASVSIKGKQLQLNGKAPFFALRREFKIVESLGDQHKYPEIYDASGKLKPNAENLLYDSNDPGEGLKFGVRIEVRNVGGSLKYGENYIQVENTKDVLIILTAATNFNGFDKSPATEGLNVDSLLNLYLSKVEEVSFDSLKVGKKKIIKHYLTGYPCI